jgi:hypothetical protein
MIVSRDREDLYEELAGMFEGSDRVQVILDRRCGPGRPPARSGSERRRLRREAAEHLDVFGWVIVRLEGEEH